MDAKDIEILQLQSGKPYLLGVGSFGSVCNRSTVGDHQICHHLRMFNNDTTTSLSSRLHRAACI